MTPPLCTVGDDCRGHDPTGNQIPPRDVWDNGHLCGVCRRRLQRWITELPALADELTDALIPASSNGGGKPSYRNAWPINPALLPDLRYDLDVFGKLAAWTMRIVEERGHTKPGRQIFVRPPIGHEGPAAPKWISDISPKELADWLTIHTDWIAHWEWGHEMYTEIRDLHQQIRHVVYPNRDRKRFLLPRHRRQCPDCGGDMYAVVAHESHAGTMVQCSGCGREWQPTEWFRLGRRILATPMQRQSA